MADDTSQVQSKTEIKVITEVIQFLNLLAILPKGDRYVCQAPGTRFYTLIVQSTAYVLHEDLVTELQKRKMLKPTVNLHQVENL